VKVAKGLETLCHKFMWPIYCRLVYKSLVKHLCSKYRLKKVSQIMLLSIEERNAQEARELRRDLSAGREVLIRVTRSSWWDWDQGSALLFWRWPGYFGTFARDGMPVHVKS